MDEIQDETSEQIISPCSSEIKDTFGYPEVIPRVGDEFQAESPPLMAELYTPQLTNMPAVNDLKPPLPIPIMWSNTTAENINGTVEFENNEESHITSTSKHPELKVEPVDALSGYMKSNIQEAIGSNKIERCMCPLPGSLGVKWTNVERDSFLLGLYIYGKNLVSVKKFVENKEMGDILSFYYGEFYKSKQYRRWSESRKLRNKRSIFGQRIFTGWRQKELLSRLFSLVSHECHNTLLEVCRTFAEGKISFEEYISTLKSMVGINMLIEAVGIGKGNHDLTVVCMEPAKANNSFSIRPEIPFGKACASLTSADIIGFLTGGFRLSKARSNNLFWEAVWPRLLARGWHSKKLKSSNIVTSVKHSSVFLTPGVKKISRRKLVKGEHYFDSVTDVLNKVATNPLLLEVEIEAANGSQNDEKCGISHLEACNPHKRQGVHKFTIVDTSLANGAEKCKVRELRSLTIEEPNCASASSSISSESEYSEEDKIETIDLNAVDNMSDEINFRESSDCVNSSPDPATVAKENHESENMNRNNDKEDEIETIDLNTVDDNMSDGRDLKDLSDCANSNLNNSGESSYGSKHISVDRMLLRDHCNHSSNCEDNTTCEEAQPQNSASSCSLERNEGIVDANRPFREKLHLSIDLNKPPVDAGVNNSSLLSETVNREVESSKVPVPDGGASRRQSKRNRPLTTKALEALEMGFFSTRKRKGAALLWQQSNSKCRSSREVHKKMDDDTNCPVDR